MNIYRARKLFVLVLIGAFFALSMAEAVAMPRELSKNAAGMAMMDMPDCTDMKMPVPCEDPNTRCLGSVCIPMMSFWTPASGGPFVQAWARRAYDGRLTAMLHG